MRASLALLLLLFAIAPARSGALTGFTICLDPGHTSETSAGTASRDGSLTERHVNWVVARDLKPLLEAEGARVVMTKISEDEVVTNRRRAEIANAAHADLFLRLHCDAASRSGLATFYPDRQGRAHGHVGPSSAVIAASRRAARLFHPAVIAALDGALTDRGIKGDSATGVGGRQGALTGSIFSRVPALTVEMVVLTESHDYRFIRAPAGQRKMARALLVGVEAYARAKG
ncbi:MAG: N-acetylmuramoyl-L-alanine amidase [Armatimonadetes bacterium]|nr:N-acetylmuramoyl-L-alanine amidase [Armatimonadota bacterium]